MTHCNLDSLIPREDFEIDDSNINQLQGTPTLQIRDLEDDTFFYKTLRKPDFQRETAEREPEKVCELVQSFLDGDLIPSVILWNSGGFNFVIDGAHRLSALISWVNNDYGDGNISKSFFGFNISQEQNDIAEKTRKMIDKKIGSYADLKYAINNSNNADKEMLKKAQKLATLTIQLQWVRGDASKAETSFFKINEQATPINETEKKLLKSRKKPNALAARAIIRSGTGHKYRSKFSSTTQQEIEEIAKKINEMLFSPRLKTPIKTLDLPLAGKGYSSQTLSLVLDLVNIANDVKDSDTINEDETGVDTIKYLKKVMKIIARISSDQPSSLGLHPIIYFYNLNGRYQISAFLGFIQFIKELETKNEFHAFTNIREKFENILLSNKEIIQNINYKLGSGIKSYKKTSEILFDLFSLLKDNKDWKDIKLYMESKYDYLKLKEEVIFSGEYETRSDFSSETKSAVFIRDSLQSSIKCKICGGYIHSNAISIDHIKRKEDGGTGNIENAQITHPYCNTTYKQ